MKKAKEHKKRKRSLLATFLRTVLFIVLGFCIVAGAGLLIYDKWFDGNDEGFTPPAVLEAITESKGRQMNIAVFGVDKAETRTDVIFVVHLDTKTKTVKLLSVPRDTYVEVCQKAQDIMDAEDRWYPTVCKINEIHAYAGKEKGPECSVAQLEDLLGISIDNYVKVNLEGFKKIVEAIDGVDMDVPQDMDYDDPYQDLHIHLKAGQQTLNGDQAEMLVRFREYPQGDVERVQVQQLFLKAFAKKILSTKTILTNLPSLISTAYTYMTTDMGLTDMVKLAKNAGDLSMDNIQMETLPGVGQYIGKVSYYVHDEAATKKVVRQMFFGEELDGSKGLAIEVANGGNITGLAGEKRDMLQEKGYLVSAISTYDGTQTNHTRIVVREDGVGQDLLEYFPNATFVVDESMLSKDIDIKIILGLDETE